MNNLKLSKAAKVSYELFNRQCGQITLLKITSHQQNQLEVSLAIEIAKQLMNENNKVIFIEKIHHVKKKTH